MDIYCVTGYCTDYESGSIRQVHEIYATREKAEQGFNDFINETRNYAQEAENIRYLGTSQGLRRNRQQKYTEACMSYADMNAPSALTLKTKRVGQCSRICQ